MSPVETAHLQRDREDPSCSPSRPAHQRALRPIPGLPARTPTAYAAARAQRRASLPCHGLEHKLIALLLWSDLVKE